MKIAEIIVQLENLAPPIYQENYDNSGLLVGDKSAEVNKVLVCLDCLEAVVDEAISKGAGLIIAHHPIIFGGLKKITGKNYIERIVIKAIKNNIAIYAIHTNLDNVLKGVNNKIGQVLGLENLKILQPKKSNLLKLVTYAPTTNTPDILEALFAAGAGNIGAYSECSFKTSGTGTFKASSSANPHVGEKEKRHSETEDRIEVLVPMHAKQSVLSTLKNSHPYEEVAFEFYAIENENQEIGAGMIGELKSEMREEDFLLFTKEKLNTQCIRHSPYLNKSVKKIAFCGGSGSFLLNQAIAAHADVFITGDFKYHEFFDANKRILIADVGHYESEQFTIDLIADYLTEKFPTFAVLKTGVNTNSIAYV